MEHIKQDQIINIPNALTVVRILLLPVVVWRFMIGDATGALIAYLAAMLTDALDGIIARKFNQITALGKLLDPLADKLSLVTLLGLFVSDGQIVAQGTPDEIRASSDPFVHQFVFGEADGPVHFHYPAEPFEQELMREGARG